MKKKNNLKIRLIALATLFGVIAFTAMAFGFEIESIACIDFSGIITSVATLAVAPLAWIKDGNFKELSADEVEKLEPNDLADYFNAKNKHDKDVLKTLIDKKASKDDIENATKSLKEGIDNQLIALNKALKEQGVAIKKIARGDVHAEKTSFVGDIKTALKGMTDDLKSMRENKDARMLSIEVKAPAAMTTANISGGNVPIEDRESGFNRLRRRRAWVLDEVQVGDTMSRVVSWVEQQNADGGAGGTAEGALKNSADFDLVVVDETVKKRTVSIKVSDEMIDDVDFMASEIETELFELLMLDIDDQILNGDNTGENLNGIITQATAWAAGGFANTIDDASNWDVLQAAINQIDLANHEPKVIFMHPTDVTKMKLTKGTDGHYVLPPFISADGLQVDGLPVRKNTGIAIDNFLVFDGSKSKVFFRKRMELRTGFVNEDFLKNMMTILAEARLTHRIKGNDLGAFVTGDFTTAKAALETV